MSWTRRTPLPVGMVRLLHARRMAGEKPGALALEAGVSYERLRLAFLRHKLEVRPKRAPAVVLLTKRGALFWTPERVLEAHAAHVAGESVTELARRAGVSVSSLSQAFRKAGLPMRVRGVLGEPPSAMAGKSHECVTVNGVCMFCG